MADEFDTVDDYDLEAGHHLQANEKIEKGQVLPNTVAVVGEDSFAGTENDRQQRWGVTPLYTTNHEFAYVGEYLCDPNTGEPAMKREDGTVVNVSEIARFNYHVEVFSNAMSYLGLGRKKIFSAFPEDDTHVPVYDGNCIDGELRIEKEDKSIIQDVALSFDLSVLTKIEGSDMLRMVDKDPVVMVEYLPESGTINQTVSLKASDWHYYLIHLEDTAMTIKNIKVPSVDAEEDYVCFIHSILIGL